MTPVLSPDATAVDEVHRVTSPPLVTLPSSAPGAAHPRGGVQTLDLIEPLAGFPRYREYVLAPANAGRDLYWLQSLAPEGPRFLAMPAAPYFPDYTPAVPTAACADLGLGSVADADLYCLVTVPDGDIAAATANLRAPVVVNPVTQQARQVVLADGRHPIRRPLRR